MTEDAAYDTVGFYTAAGARGAAVVVPPTSTANVSRHGPRSIAREVPAEAFRRFKTDMQQRRAQAMRTREEQLAIHLERRRLVHEWIVAQGTPDQQARATAGMLPLEEDIDAMATAAFAPLSHLPTYVRDGAARLRLIALIEQAAVVGRILRHLGLPTDLPVARPVRAPPLFAGAAGAQDDRYESAF